MWNISYLSLLGPYLFSSSDDVTGSNERLKLKYFQHYFVFIFHYIDKYLSLNVNIRVFFSSI